MQLELNHSKAVLIVKWNGVLILKVETMFVSCYLVEKLKTFS